LVRKNVLREVAAKEKAQAGKLAPYLISTSRLANPRVNPPNFEIYFCRRMRELAGIGCFRGLDNFSALPAFGGFSVPLCLGGKELAWLG
jgi:hypothetical protein